MAPTRTRRPALVGMVALALLTALAATRTSPAAGTLGASGGSRAVVIIDDGNTRRQACLVFDGSLSGLEALERATGTVTTAGFGSMGAAVCAIDGKGCSPSACLRCAAPDYWHYFRSDAGTGSFGASGVGASATTVGDGDVEAWVWGASVSPPPRPAIDDVCPKVTTTVPTTVRTTVPPPAPTPVPTPTPTGVPSSVTTAVPSGGPVPATTPTPTDPEPTNPGIAPEPPSDGGARSDDDPAAEHSGGTASVPDTNTTSPSETGDGEGAESGGAASDRPTDTTPGAGGSSEVAAGSERADSAEGLASVPQVGTPETGPAGLAGAALLGVGMVALGVRARRQRA